MEYDIKELERRYEENERLGFKGYRAHVEQEARRFAETINGGSWDTDYGEHVKTGWRLKALYMMDHVNGHRAHGA